VIEHVVDNEDDVIDGDSDIDEDEEDEDEEDEEDEDEVEVEVEEAIPLRSAALQLADLISPKGGSVREMGVKNVKRRVMRKDGIASKAAVLFEQVIEEVNKGRDLELFPLTLVQVLSYMKEGKVVLALGVSTKDTRILAEAATKIVKSAGRASRATVVGLLATPNSEGQLSVQKIAELSGVSKSYISSSRAKQMVTGPKVFSTYTDQNMVNNVTRAGVPEIELV
jgi:hypothetical protein